MNIDQMFLEENEYIDFNNDVIKSTAERLFYKIDSDVDKARIAYEFVRDKIPHTFDIKSNTIVSKASDVLIYKTGICHAKSNLLAALLRLEKIKCGFCFQHLTLVSDDSLGYCVHGYNAAFINNKWIKIDARGNKKGINAKFSLDKPVLAYKNREEYDEYFWPGIYSKPHLEVMKMLDEANTLEDIMNNFPDYVKQKPDIIV